MIKILGIGSPFGDDQVGWKVVEALKVHMIVHPDIQLMSCDRPGIRLIELMRGGSSIILIDAVKTGQKKGVIHRLEGEDIQALNTVFSTHDIGIAEALQIGSALNELPKHIVLYGIEIDEVEVDSTLSEPVQRAVGAVVLQIKTDCRDGGYH